MKYFYFLFFALFINSTVYAQYPVDAIPKELLSRAVATIRDENTQIQIKSPTEVLITGNKVVTIHNQSGEDYGNILFYYDKSKQVKEVKGEILDQFGKQIRKFSLKDFKDYSASAGSSLFDEFRVKAYEPLINNYPITISYSYEIKSTQSLVLPSWQPDYSKDVSIEKSTYKIVAPAQEELRINSKNINFQPNVETIDKLKTYYWKVDNIKAIRQEPYSPSRQLTGMKIQVVPKSFQYYKTKGEFADWKTFGLWMNESLLKDKRKLPEATIAHVKEITKDLKTDQEKAKALYEYMQKKTRYISIQIGIGGFEPFTAESVDRLGYGDCKALVNYMQALLEVVNIPSYYCIVESGDRRVDVDPEFANIQDGDHIILCLPFPQDTTWLECTSQDAPYGYLGSFTDDRLVLACTPEGGKIMRTSSYPSDKNSQQRIANLKLDITGKLTGDLETTYKGTQFSNHFANVKLIRDKQLENLKKWYNFNRISFNQFSYDVDDQNEHSLKEKINISIDNYATISGNHLTVMPNVFSKTDAIPDIRNRQSDVKIYRGFVDIDEINIQVDDGILLLINPETKKINTPMGSFEFITKVDGNVLKCYRRIQIIEGNYPAADYEKMFEMMKEASLLDNMKYNLTISQKK